jgi:hypothetical protein
VTNTTNDGEADAVSSFAYADDAERLNLSTAEDAKALGQPLGVYGEGKYGECRMPTLQEQSTGVGKSKPHLEKTEA